MIALNSCFVLLFSVFAVVSAFQSIRLKSFSLDVTKLNYPKTLTSNIKLAKPYESRGTESNWRLFSDMQPGERKGILRENEGEFFETEFDKKPMSDRIPTLIAFVTAVSLPFIVGLFVLYSNK